MLAEFARRARKNVKQTVSAPACQVAGVCNTSPSAPAHLERNADRARIPHGLQQLLLILEGDVDRAHHARPDAVLGELARSGLRGAVWVGLMNTRRG